MIGNNLARLAVLVAPMVLADLASARDIQAIDVRYESGKVPLAALLMLPPGDKPVPAAVIAQGSGASDRSNRWSQEIAEELVNNGLAVLLTDKRGAGASGGDWRTAGFSDLAADVLAGVELLRGRSEIDPGRIGVVGLSQGGQFVPLAAAGSDRIAFVISISSKAVGFAEGSFFEMANTARQAGLSEPDVREIVQLNLAALRFLTTGRWEQYARAREHALETTAREVAVGFPASADEPIWTFLRSVATYDPLVYWMQVGQPVLIVYGEEDEHDNAPVRESVRRLEHAFRGVNKTNYRILVVPGAGHGLRDPQTHRLAPSFTKTLAAWLREYVAP